MAELSVANADLFVAAKPTIGGEAVNEIRYYAGPDQEVIMWRWDGFEWVGHCLSPAFGGGNPNGTKTSVCVNHLYVDTTNQTLYRATVANSNNNWVQV